MRWFLLSALSLLLLAGCAHVFSDRAEMLVDQKVTFEQVRKEPQAYVGKYVKVGGIIADTKNTRDGSQIEVVQLGLNYDDVPDEEEGYGGRFLATSRSYLDSMIFKVGRPVALVGEVKGEKTLPLGEIEYTYPVIAITEIHVWKKSDLYSYPPSYYYDPFYYPYGWYGPYWYPRYRYR